MIAAEPGIDETVPLQMLRKDVKIELLKRVPLFERCSKRELAQIALLTDELSLPDGRDLTRQGESGREFVVLVEGAADVVRNGRVVNELGPGDFVGEIALVRGEPRTATVRTRGPSRLLVLSASGFRSLMHEVPSIQDKVLAALAARIVDNYE
jgi:CRP-like cAMP-binding protein